MSKKYKSIVIIFIVLSIILSDWRLNSFIHFSDLSIFFALVFICFDSSYYVIDKSQMKIIIYLSLIVIFNLVFNMIFNNEYVFLQSIIPIFKVIYYAYSISVMYNYIKGFSLYDTLSYYLIFATIIVCIIGLILNFLLYFNSNIPHDFFWYFTRSDVNSYTYGGITTIIRMRSIFSEPAHLGYYINGILALFYFNKNIMVLKKKHEILFIVCCLMTLSFSAIFVLISILILRYYKSFKKIFNVTSLKKPTVWFFIVGTILIFGFSYNTIYMTLISRITRIFNGSDTSAMLRIFGSWSHINTSNILFGTGFGNSPTLYNNFAYIITEFGIVSIPILAFCCYKIAKFNWKYLVFFIIINFVKGGYMSGQYWIFIFIFVILSLPATNEQEEFDIHEKNINNY